MDAKGQMTMDTPLKTQTHFPTHEFTLGNGLRIIVREDHRQSQCFSTVVYGVGESHENHEDRGLSTVAFWSMLEYSAEQEKRLQDAGGHSENFNGPVAINSISLAAEHLQTAFAVHAEMMTSTLNEKRIRKNIEHLIDRHKRNSHFVSAISYSPELEALIETGTNGYKPADGLVEHLEQLNLEQIHTWRQTWFGPDNALLVVAGGVTASKVKQLAEEHFGGIERGNVPGRAYARGAPEPGYRQITQYMDVERPLMQIVFNTPSLTTTTDVRSVRALEVLGSLLSDCIPERLIEAGAVPGAIFCSFPLHRRGDTRIGFSYYFEVDGDEAEAGFWTLLDEARHTPFSDDEIERAVETLCEKELATYDTLMTQSMGLGWAVALGTSIPAWEGKVEQLRDVTPSEVQQAAQMLLTRERVTVGRMLPMQAQVIAGPDM